MARNTYETWIPEEYDSAVIQRVTQLSAVEAFASRIPMKSDTKNVPRSAGVDVESIAKGGTYGEDTSVNDGIVLTARKFGKAIRIAEEDIDDALASIISTKQRDWATSYAKFIDNATLGTTAAENGTTVPFTSLYRALRSTNAATGYTADANRTVSGTPLGAVTFTDTGDVVTFPAPHGLAVGDRIIVGTVTSTTGITAGTAYFVKTVPTATTATLSATNGGATLALTTDGSAASSTKLTAPSYQNLSAAMGQIETGDYFDAGSTRIIAHPAFRAFMRGVVDNQNRPVFIEGLAGTPSTLFGMPVAWSLGAKTSATATTAPGGNPLMFIGNTDYLRLGIRSGPESIFIDGRNGLGALTDESILKMRARRGFAVGHEAAWSVLEVQ